MMTASELERKAAELLNGLLEMNLADYEILLRDHGADEQEIANELAIARDQLMQHRDAELCKLHGWLARGGEVLH
jgi:hypothetical protein